MCECSCASVCVRVLILVLLLLFPFIYYDSKCASLTSRRRKNLFFFSFLDRASCRSCNFTIQAAARWSSINWSHVERKCTPPPFPLGYHPIISVWWWWNKPTKKINKPRVSPIAGKQIRYKQISGNASKKNKRWLEVGDQSQPTANRHFNAAGLAFYRMSFSILGVVTASRWVLLLLPVDLREKKKKHLTLSVGCVFYKRCKLWIDTPLFICVALEEVHFFSAELAEKICLKKKAVGKVWRIISCTRCGWFIHQL